MSTVIDSIERRQERQGLPSFASGDRVRVHFKVREGSRERTQVFEGIVLKRQGSGARETFTVRKQSFGVGVERTFPLHSPKIEKLEIAARGDLQLLDLRRVEREGPLDADAERLLADGERLTRAGALPLEHDPLEDLGPLARALADLEVDAHAVARGEGR